MKFTLPLAEDFGPRLSDGALAVRYRLERIEPFVEMCEGITLDFTGVRSANSSFVNALLAGTVEQHGERALRVLTFKGCNPVIHVLVESALQLGLSQSEERVLA